MAGLSELKAIYPGIINGADIPVTKLGLAAQSAVDALHAKEPAMSTGCLTLSLFCNVMINQPFFADVLHVMQSAVMRKTRSERDWHAHRQALLQSGRDALAELDARVKQRKAGKKARAAHPGRQGSVGHTRRASVVHTRAMERIGRRQSSLLPEHAVQSLREEIFRLAEEEQREGSQRSHRSQRSNSLSRHSGSEEHSRTEDSHSGRAGSQQGRRPQVKAVMGRFQHGGHRRSSTSLQAAEAEASDDIDSGRGAASNSGRRRAGLEERSWSHDELADADTPGRRARGGSGSGHARIASAAMAPHSVPLRSAKAGADGTPQRQSQSLLVLRRPSMQMPEAGPLDDAASERSPVAIRAQGFSAHRSSSSTASDDLRHSHTLDRRSSEQQPHQRQQPSSSPSSPPSSNRPLQAFAAAQSTSPTFHSPPLMGSRTGSLTADRALVDAASAGHVPLRIRERPSFSAAQPPASPPPAAASTAPSPSGPAGTRLVRASMSASAVGLASAPGCVDGDESPALSQPLSPAAPSLPADAPSAYGLAERIVTRLHSSSTPQRAFSLSSQRPSVARVMAGDVQAMDSSAKAPLPADGPAVSQSARSSLTPAPGSSLMPPDVERAADGWMATHVRRSSVQRVMPGLVQREGGGGGDPSSGGSFAPHSTEDERWRGRADSLPREGTASRGSVSRELHDDHRSPLSSDAYHLALLHEQSAQHSPLVPSSTAPFLYAQSSAHAAATRPALLHPASFHGRRPSNFAPSWADPVSMAAASAGGWARSGVGSFSPVQHVAPPMFAAAQPLYH